ncbi:hypothetical protein Bca101_054102 [Brassica carinata]
MSVAVPRVGRKCAKCVDSTWDALFFFSFYFKPALNDKSNAKIVRDSNLWFLQVGSEAFILIKSSRILSFMVIKKKQ